MMMTVAMMIHKTIVVEKYDKGDDDNLCCDSLSGS
jgi:hypothetical protein